jgi:hypothetical protein
VSGGDTVKLVYVGAIGVGVLALAYFASKYGKDFGKTAGKYAVDQAAGLVGGVLQGVGIPETNMSECDRAIAEGRTLDASFACPAGTFLSSFFKSRASSSSTSPDVAALRAQYAGFTP